ncbi:MAG: hypothetical protein WAW85_04740 [Gordonia sp. (in: high G+C Gram-positive bacteria)]|uniref:hypothetical protein n=1 Tax=Gordonia sp. (in: high G+C Gram-positive bacteria) TaxID=84139 RepID=UPI003BB79CB4
MHRMLVVTLTALLVLTGCSVTGTPTRGPQPPPVTEQSVALAPDRDTEITVSESWTITVPRGAAPASATLDIRPSEDSLPSTEYQHTITSAEVSLSSGQPSVPLVFRYTLPDPVAEGTDVYLVGRNQVRSEVAGEDVTALAPIRATLDESRRTATASVPHLSVWDWVTDAAIETNHFLNSVLGIRSDAPSCETQPVPKWFDKAIFLDSKEAPMRVCVGADPGNRDLAVVKINNNRGIAIIVTGPVTPVWAHQSQWSGQPSDIAAEIESATIRAFGLPSSVASRTWVVPPGGTLDIGFSSGSLPLTSKITASANIWTVLYGLLWKLAEEAVDDPLTFSALEVGSMAACFGSAANTALGATESSKAGVGMAAAALCVMDKPADVLSEVAGRLSDRAFDEMRKRRIASKVGRASARYLPVLNAITNGLIVSDAGLTTQLPDGAWEIGLFKHIDPATTLNALCGRIDDRREVKHPQLGTVTIGIRREEKSRPGQGCIAAVDSGGKKLLVQKVTVYGDALDFVDPVTDATNNVFIKYNPGRYNGVITLVPNKTGYEDIGWGEAGGYQSTTHAYYSAGVIGPGPDGRYTIKELSNDCNPACASGTITSKILTWNGQRYE